MRCGDRNPVPRSAGAQRIVRRFPQLPLSTVDSDSKRSNIKCAASKPDPSPVKHACKEGDLHGRIPRQYEATIQRDP